MRDLLAALAELRERLKEIPQADERRLSDLKTEILGRKAGALTQIIGRLPRLDPSSKKEVGAAANALKRDFEAAFEARERELKRAAGAVTGVDLTMPGRAGWQGGLHLVTQVVDEICDIFRELGFTRAVGPEAETEHYNFVALNFPKDHPALDAQDSFYLGGDVLLRTHTSPVQIRTLERYPPPIRVVIPGGLRLAREQLRGVESNGMLCSANELGLGADHTGILELDTAAAPGTRFVDAVGIADHQLMIDVPANRPDLLCHKGVARELGASLGAPVKLPPIPGAKPLSLSPPVRQSARGVVDGVEVRLEDPEGAPRYMIAVIRGVRVGPSPAWLAGRLTSVGQRPINNVVDATNYILFELNQPLHAFDLAKLRGPAVVVRRARPGDKIVTLDGVTRTLTADMTAIGDAEHPTSIAGVMGR